MPQTLPRHRGRRQKSRAAAPRSRVPDEPGRREVALQHEDVEPLSGRLPAPRRAAARSPGSRGAGPRPWCGCAHDSDHLPAAEGAQLDQRAEQHSSDAAALRRSRNVDRVLDRVAVAGPLSERPGAGEAARRRPPPGRRSRAVRLPRLPRVDAPSPPHPARVLDAALTVARCSRQIAVIADSSVASAATSRGAVRRVIGASGWSSAPARSISVTPVERWIRCSGLRAARSR